MLKKKDFYGEVSGSDDPLLPLVQILLPSRFSYIFTMYQNLLLSV